MTLRNLPDISNEAAPGDPDMNPDDLHSSTEIDAEEETEEFKAHKDKSEVELFEIADGNNDGTLTADEYLDFVLNVYKPPKHFGLTGMETEDEIQEHLKDNFYVFDKNGNGYITLDEILDDTVIE